MAAVEDGCEKNSDKNSDQCGLDAILIRIGQFGKFQIRNYAIIILPMIFNGYLTFSYIFLTSSLFHRCKVPECDGPTSGYDEPWTDFSIPMTSDGEMDGCSRYVPYNRSSNMCFAGNYDQYFRESCGIDFIFRDNELSISNDFDIYCADEWKLTIVGTISVAGQVVGAPVGGYFSDRYGRRSVVAIGGFLSALLGIIRSFSPNYWVFLGLGFLEHVCSAVIYSTLFIIGVEWVSQKARALSCSFITMFFIIGEVLLAVVAKYVQNWRWTLSIVYIPALAHIALLWLIPESVRWLLSQGNEEKAAEVLRKAAKINNRKLSDITIENLILEHRQKLAKENKSQFPIKEAFQVFPWRIINCSFCWFSNLLVYHGLNLMSVLLGGNKYDNFIYVSLVGIPAIILLYYTMNRFGRRYSLFFYQLIAGICLASTIYISPDSYVLQLSMFLVGKLANTISFEVLFFFTSEIFPTNVRNSLFSFCLMIGKIGSMMAPQTVMLVKYNKSAPAVIFSFLALVAGVLSLLFPETTNIILPTTMAESGDICKKKEGK